MNTKKMTLKARGERTHMTPDRVDNNQLRVIAQVWDLDFAIFGLRSSQGLGVWVDANQRTGKYKSVLQGMTKPFAFMVDKLLT